MNSHNIITMKENDSCKGGAHTCATPALMYNPYIAESNGQRLLDNNFLSKCPSLYVQTKSLNSSSSQQGVHFHPKLLSPKLKTSSPISDVSHPQYPENTSSRSSSFCTSLYSSPSTTLETQRQLGKIQFLPHPPKCNQPVSVIHSLNSPSLLGGDIGDCWDMNSCTEDLMQGFLDLPGDASEGSFHGESYPCKSLAFADQLDFILSEELGLAITSNGENPGLDEIYETPKLSSVPEVGSKCQTHQHLVPPVGIPIHSRPLTSTPTAVNKPRLRWTLELHERFLEAVNKLDGPEKATPKCILKRMNVEGLTICHIKSHLQKYRLAKYLPETKEDKMTSSSEEKVASSSNEGDSCIKGSMQVMEALRMQLEVQKQLLEQLEMQRALQLRIEEQATYLQKILEEQEKAGNKAMSNSIKQSSPDQRPNFEIELGPSSAHVSLSQALSRTCSISSTPTKQKAIASDIEFNHPAHQKKARLEEARPEIIPHESIDEN